MTTHWSRSYRNRAVQSLALVALVATPSLLAIGCASGDSETQRASGGNPLIQHGAGSASLLEEDPLSERAGRDRFFGGERDPLNPRSADAAISAGEASAMTGELGAVAEPPAELLSAVPDAEVFRTDEGSTHRTRASAPSLPEDARIRQHAAELAVLLRARAERAVSPAAELARLAALDLIEPGTFNSHVVDLQGRSAAELLSERELTTLAAWRDFIGDADQTLISTGSVMDLAAPLDTLRDQFADLRPLMIPRLALATSVKGFGVVSKLREFDGRYKFIATRPHTVLVYVEVDRFGNRAATQDGERGHRVDLAIELELYQQDNRNDLLVWRTEPQEITDFSLNRRRDFYITQRITLPPTLTVGSYSLKAIVKDRNNDDVAAERVVPIDLVADRNALVSGK